MATDKDKDKDKALRDMRLEAFDAGYRKGYQQGRLDGAKDCATNLVNAHSSHLAECTCQACDVLDWVNGGARPAWAGKA